MKEIDEIIEGEIETETEKEIGIGETTEVMIDLGNVMT